MNKDDKILLTDTLLNRMEFRNVPKDILPWLEKIAIENNCSVEKKEWRSKYRSYVVYGYEPFRSNYFEINIILFSISRNYLKFIQYLYDERIKNINHLECSYNKEKVEA